MLYKFSPYAGIVSKIDSSAAQIIRLFNKLHNCEIHPDVNCAVSNADADNVCAYRTMQAAHPRATMSACGCKNLGADILHLLQRVTGNGDSAELQSQLGSGLCSISTLHTYLLFGSSFSSIFGSPPPPKGGGASYPPLNNAKLRIRFKTDGRESQKIRRSSYGFA